MSFNKIILKYLHIYVVLLKTFNSFHHHYRADIVNTQHTSITTNFNCNNSEQCLEYHISCCCFIILLLQENTGGVLVAFLAD